MPRAQEITSPVEYETLALLGTNCGLTNPDDLARMNQHCNDLGIDTIETGAMIAVLMDAGLAPFGDVGLYGAGLCRVTGRNGPRPPVGPGHRAGGATSTGSSGSR